MANELDIEIRRIVAQHPEGASSGDIMRQLGADIPRSTLRDRLNGLIDDEHIVKHGERKGTRYFGISGEDAATRSKDDSFRMRNPASRKVVEHLSMPVNQREPANYNDAFLASYEFDHKSFYLTEQEMAHLQNIGEQDEFTHPTGTFVSQIYSQFLIDLSWNSSRLEGNTYSLAETKKLIEFDSASTERDSLETQMIINHKKAIEYSVKNIAEIEVNEFTIKSLHAFLADELISDRRWIGSLRQVPVSISSSTFTPLGNSHQINECFGRIAAVASRITNPFEQAFFLMVHLPYLQPFQDVNKRTSRLALNIPLLKHDLVPLSFVDVSKNDYRSAILGVYELNEISLLKELFIWSYECSVKKFKNIQENVGRPNPFRQKYKEQLDEVVACLVRERVLRERASTRIAEWSQENVPAEDREAFAEHALKDIHCLKEEVRPLYGLTDSEFSAWRDVWRKLRVPENHSNGK